MFLRTLSLSCLCCLFVSGCGDIFGLNEKPDKGIIGKTTQDVGKADDKDRKNASDSKVRVDNPITGPLQAYGPMMEQLSKSFVQHDLDLFYADTGKYPKDHEEFMQRIIKDNHRELPVLPFGAKYKYDVENHKLLIVPSDEKSGAK